MLLVDGFRGSVRSYLVNLVNGIDEEATPRYSSSQSSDPLF